MGGWRPWRAGGRCVCRRCIWCLRVAKKTYFFSSVGDLAGAMERSSSSSSAGAKAQIVTLESAPVRSVRATAREAVTRLYRRCRSRSRGRGLNRHHRGFENLGPSPNFRRVFLQVQNAPFNLNFAHKRLPRFDFKPFTIYSKGFAQLQNAMFNLNFGHAFK